MKSKIFPQEVKVKKSFIRSDLLQHYGVHTHCRYSGGSSCPLARRHWRLCKHIGRYQTPVAGEGMSASTQWFMMLTNSLQTASNHLLLSTIQRNTKEPRHSEEPPPSQRNLHTQRNLHPHRGTSSLTKEPPPSQRNPPHTEEPPPTQRNPHTQRNLHPHRATSTLTEEPPPSQSNFHPHRGTSTLKKEPPSSQRNPHTQRNLHPQRGTPTHRGTLT